jgi:hypothetical protein
MRFGLPSALRGIPGVGYFSHWAVAGPPKNQHITIAARAGNLFTRILPVDFCYLPKVPNLHFRDLRLPVPKNHTPVLHAQWHCLRTRVRPLPQTFVWPVIRALAAS